MEGNELDRLSLREAKVAALVEVADDGGDDIAACCFCSISTFLVAGRDCLRHDKNLYVKIHINKELDQQRFRLG